MSRAFKFNVSRFKLWPPGPVPARIGVRRFIFVFVAIETHFTPRLMVLRWPPGPKFLCAVPPLRRCVCCRNSTPLRTRSERASMDSGGAAAATAHHAAALGTLARLLCDYSGDLLSDGACRVGGGVEGRARSARARQGGRGAEEWPLTQAARSAAEMPSLAVVSPEWSFFRQRGSVPVPRACLKLCWDVLRV